MKQVNNFPMPSMQYGTDAVAFNTMRSSQNGRYLKDDILKCTFLNENVLCSLKPVTKDPINNIPGLGQINGLAPTRWQAIIWTNDVLITDAYMRYSAPMS